MFQLMSNNDQPKGKRKFTELKFCTAGAYFAIYISIIDTQADVRVVCVGMS